MWIFLALASALGLGFYDVMKKISVRGNNVLAVLMINTLIGAALMSPVLVADLADGRLGPAPGAVSHLLILVKSVIVLGSWVLGYFAIKHLPLTIQGPVNATRPVMVLVGAMVIFGERLNAVQWAGILLGFSSLFFISRIGASEGFSLRDSRWLWMSVGATVLGAVSALYDKFLLQRFEPLEVQAWYSLYQAVIMTVTLALINRAHGGGAKFVWRWSIVGISLFLTAADLAYFYCLSQPDAMISIVSMIRRGSVLIPFVYGVVVLHERHVRRKLIDLGLLMLSLLLLVIGSQL